MDTDRILDFVVDNYIWFIVAGVIVLLALIGVVVEKHKLIPKNIKKDDSKNFDEGMKSNENVTSLETNQNIEEMTFDEEVNVKDEEINNAPVQNVENTTEMDIFTPTESFNDTPNTISESQVESEVSETVIPEENNLEYVESTISESPVVPEELPEVNEPEYTEFASNDEQIVPEENNSEYVEPAIFTSPVVPEVSEPAIDDAQINTEELIKSDELNKEETTTSDDSKKSESGEYPFSLTSVDDDIDNLNKMKFSDEDTDKLEDTMQISYSQLKEMVKDIMDENESEKKVEDNEHETVANETEESSNKEDVQEPTPKDDEDDVWKF